MISPVEDFPAFPQERSIHPMRLRDHPFVTWIIWAILIAAATFATFTQRWDVVFVSITALVLTILPALFVERFQIRLPLSFLAAISVFVFATLFLGEVFDFYERYWWWDVLLHGGSAIGFGIIGFLFVFYLFEGNKYAAPPIAIAFVAYCFAVTIGTGWEIFEFLMDQIFGLNMQKSGLVDTMWDLIVDSIGATIGATAGFFYLKGRQLGGLPGLIAEFLSLNRRLFRKNRP
jgi:VanZ family protein